MCSGTGRAFTVSAKCHVPQDFRRELFQRPCAFLPSLIHPHPYTCIYTLCATGTDVLPPSFAMSTTPSLSLKSFFTGSAPNSTTTSTVLPSTKQDVAKAEALPPRQGASLSCTSISCLTLPIAYRQIISLHRKTPDQQDIEEWDRARTNLKLRWEILFMAVSNVLPILHQCIS